MIIVDLDNGSEIGWDSNLDQFADCDLLLACVLVDMYTNWYVAVHPLLTVL